MICRQGSSRIFVALHGQGRVAAGNRSIKKCRPPAPSASSWPCSWGEPGLRHR